jgi:hypothetical protein
MSDKIVSSSTAPRQFKANSQIRSVYGSASVRKNTQHVSLGNDATAKPKMKFIADVSGLGPSGIQTLLTA